MENKENKIYDTGEGYYSNDIVKSSKAGPATSWYI